MDKFRITIFFIVMTGFCCMAQDTIGKKREYYLSVSNLSPLQVNMQYKKELKTDRFLKFSLLSLSVRSSNNLQSAGSFSYPYTSSLYSFGIGLGYEFRSMLGQRFAFFHGPNVSGNYRYFETKIIDTNGKIINSDNDELYFSIPYTIGIIFRLKQHFFLSAELNPSISYGTTTARQAGSTFKNNSVNLELDTRGALVSLVYRR